METLKEGYFYHIYNRGAGSDKLFFSRNDYRDFLKKYEYYLCPALQTFAWCLIENHFHFLIRPSTLDEQVKFYLLNKEKFESGYYHGIQNPEKKPFNASKQISHLMNSYTRYINKKKGRSGTLIEGPFKRIKVLDESNFLNLICYIHRNPIHHNITKSYSVYPYSSYCNFINKRKSFIELEQVIEKFGGIRNFKEAHEEFRLKVISSENLLLE
jgi:REP element-mobilizing transposase RayT